MLEKFSFVDEAYNITLAFNLGEEERAFWLFDNSPITLENFSSIVKTKNWLTNEQLCRFDVLLSLRNKYDTIPSDSSEISHSFKKTKHDFRLIRVYEILNGTSNNKIRVHKNDDDLLITINNDNQQQTMKFKRQQALLISRALLELCDDWPESE